MKFSLFALAALCLPSASLALRPRRSHVKPALDSSLALRGGGVTNDQLIGAMAGLNIVQGLGGWVAPKTIIQGYGVTDMTKEESAFLRFLMGMNVVAGATLLADEKTAVHTCLLAWGLSTSANVPVLEGIDAPKGPCAGSIATFLALGELARQGKISDDIAFSILSSMLILISAGELVKPQVVLDSFGVKQCTPLAKSLFANFSWTKLSTGLFLVVGKLTGNRGLGLAASAGCNAINCVTTVTRSKEIGVNKSGLIVWTALQTAVAVMAFKNEQSE